MMNNKELLLMGGGNLYPDATHWLTIGTATNSASGSKEYGFSDGTYRNGAPSFGELQPRAVDGFTITDMIVIPTADPKGLLIYFSTAPTNATFELTLLEIGKTWVSSVDSSNKYVFIFITDDNGEMTNYFVSSLGKAIPIKFVVR